jgi:DNA mismatch repair protein MutS2
MKMYPKDVYEKLEFDKILDLCSAECLGTIGKNLISNIKPAVDFEEIKQNLNLVWEYIESFRRNDPVPLSNYEDIADELYLLQKEGYVLSVESIKKLYYTSSIGNELHAYFGTNQRRKLSQGLFKIYDEIYLVDPDVNKEIDRVIDEEGEIRPTASEELQKIYKRIQSKQKELLSIYSKIIHQAKSKGLLTDSAESFRNGRRVLSVPVENKNKLSGVIHDESATGKTVFIEPAETIVINNDLFNLYTDKKKEIYKVLKHLCDSLRPHTESFKILSEGIGRIDSIRAKSRVSMALEGQLPEIQDEPIFKIITGYNPVLKYKFGLEGRVIVPFTAELHGNNHILVISGPNAGGKSVTMKSIGLLQIMVQCGFCVPVDPNSKFGVFKNIFVDIGDQQSIEDDLSTYSSHLQNLKHFSENSDERTLFLIDEFGSGTDPKIGGAIAEAVLRNLHKSGAYGVVTTHYSNLKYFAFKTKGIVNASMEFDSARLNPTFVLKVGKPGSSFAYEIATKSGISKEIISYAKHKTGKNEKAIDELLIKLQEEQKETEEKMNSIIEKEDKLNKLIKNYENLHRELEFRRKKLKLAQKEKVLFNLGEQNKEIQKVVKEIKEEKKVESAQKVAKEYKERKEKVKQEVQILKEAVYYADTVDKSKLKIGGYAKIRSGTQTGKITNIRNGVAEMEMGFLTMEVPLNELQPAGAPVEVNSKVSIQTNVSSSREGAKTKIDVRGYTPLDTTQMIQEFIDNALINNVNHLTIIHGRGNGVLRKTVLKKLKEYKEIKKVSHPEEEFGGKAVTYVNL